MNATQLKYAVERAKALRNKHLAALEAKYVTPAVSLSPSEKRKALKDGEFTVAAISRDYYWYDAVQFTAETPKKEAPGYNTAIARVESAYNTLLDQLHLGDSERALKLLEAFEKRGV